MATATSSSSFLCWLLLVQLAILGGAEEQDGMITWDDLFLKDNETPFIYVAKDGSGDVETIQAAFELVPANNKQRVKILVFPGLYTEKITLDSTKPYVSLIGADRSTTIITWNETAGSTGNTAGSATMTVRAKFFCAFNITIENSAPSPLPGETNKQAVALLLAAEKTVIYRCNILGFQDTLYDQQGVHLLYQSYIRGTIDFICGSGQSLYKECTLDSVAKSYGAFKASQRSRADDSGFVFSGCELKGSGQLYLGRTWGAFARVIFTGCFFTDVVRPEGWGTMGSSGSTSDVFLGEFNCTGPGSNLSQRVPWMHKLSEDEMKPFLGYTFINGVEWLKLDPVQGGAKD